MLSWLRKKAPKCEIVVNAESLETRVAVIENGRVEEFQVEHPTEERLVGSIFKGRIQNLEHDLQAAFVDIGLKKNAFLHYWDMLPDDAMRLGEEGDAPRNNGRGSGSRRRKISKERITRQFPPGSEIVVQVTKGAIGTKGPRVSAALSIPGRYLVMMPGCGLRGVSRKIGDAKERQRLKKILDRLPIPDDIGLIIRTAGAGATKRSFVRDLRGLLTIWEDLQTNIRDKAAPDCVYAEPDLAERVLRDWMTQDIDRVVVDSEAVVSRIRDVAARISRRSRGLIQHYEGPLPIFVHYGVEQQLEETFRRKVNLPSGGYLIVDETEAMIAIDVNTGRHKGKGGQVDAILAVNLEAVDEVARQLRLRNIGGLVVVDFIDMRARKHQNQVYRAMKTVLKRDRARTNVLPISDLGLMEMTRQRVEESLLSQRYIDCPYCHGRGLIQSPLTMSVEVQRKIVALVRKGIQEKHKQDLQISIHPTLLERLRRDDEPFLVDMEQRYGVKLRFKSEPLRHAESFLISDAETGETLFAVDPSKPV